MDAWLHGDLRRREEIKCVEIRDNSWEKKLKKISVICVICGQKSFLKFVLIRGNSWANKKNLPEGHLLYRAFPAKMKQFL
jgi:hypothetical protein